MVLRQALVLSTLAMLVGCGPMAVMAPQAMPQSQTAGLRPGSAKTVAQIKLMIPKLAERFVSHENPKDFRLSPGEAATFRQLNQDLNRDPALRAQGYPLSEPLVQQYMSQPGKVDNVPRMPAAKFAEMQRLLQAGDVIQCGNNGSFIHGIVYLGDDRIVHALAQPGNGREMAGVVGETLSGYFGRVERDQVVVLRPRWTPAKLAKAKAYALAQVGKPYDTLFLTDADDRFYCTELVRSTLQAAGAARIEPQMAKGVWQIVTNDDIRRSPDLAVVYRYNRS